MKSRIYDILTRNSLFKDSFWAVVGNAVGNSFLLISGIFIARLLGRDIYGEYGMVKTTMFYIATFSTFGLGFSTTKFVANCLEECPGKIRKLISSAYHIVMIFSSFVALILLLFANELADYLDEPSMSIAFRALAFIIIAKAINTTQIGILAGLKEFKKLARNIVFSSFSMFAICIPLTYYYGLIGSLVSLFVSQLIDCILNYFSIRKVVINFNYQKAETFYKKLINFSFPIAMQECSFTLCNWLTTIIIAKYASLGELGIYTAVAQWNAIILFIPSVLTNVILSYLSSTNSDIKTHQVIIRKMVVINVLCTLLPFIIIFFLSDAIISFYGKSFVSMKIVFNTMVFSSIFICTANVFTSDLISKGKTWIVFLFRFIRDIGIVVTLYFLLQINDGNNGAFYMALATLLFSILFSITLFMHYALSKHIKV